MRASIKIKILKLYIIIPAMAGIIMFMGACKNDIKEVQLFLNDSTSLPDSEGKNVEFYYTDSAKTKLKVIAPELRQFSNREIPYIEFPKGIEVYQYDDSLNIISTIKSNYAIYMQNDELWRAEKNVQATNIDGDVLNTELLFWDTRAKKIYTDYRVKILTADGEIFGKGLDANQDFTNWEIRESTGTYYFEEDDI